MFKLKNTVIVSLLSAIIVFGAIFIYGHFSNNHSDNNVLHKFTEKLTGKKNVCRDNINSLQAAVNRYKSDNSEYPSNIDELKGNYIKKIPKCPGGNGYSIDSDGKVFEDSNN
jgi:hypothetical protein